MKYTDQSPLNADSIVPGEQEIVRNIGKSGYMGRMPAFAGLAKATGGLYVEDLNNGMTVEEAITKAGLDFTVEALPDVQAAYTDNAGVGYVTHPDYRMNVARHKDGRITPLGLTKGRYEIVQNEAAFAFGQVMIGEGGANVAAAGQYGNPLGSRTYLALALDPFTIGGQDPHQLFVTVLNSHDGGTGLVALLAPIRITCTNQSTATFGRKAANRISLRHTASIEGRLDEARQVLGLADRWLERFTKAADTLLAETMTEGQFVRHMENTLGKPTDNAPARSHTIHDNRMTDLTRLFTDSPTNQFGRGTRYAAYNTVTEYLDWTAPVRGGNTPEIVRYTRTLDGAKDDLKARIFTTLIPTTKRKELDLATR